MAAHKSSGAVLVVRRELRFAGRSAEAQCWCDYFHFSCRGPTTQHGAQLVTPRPVDLGNDTCLAWRGMARWSADVLVQQIRYPFPPCQALGGAMVRVTSSRSLLGYSINVHINRSPPKTTHHVRTPLYHKRKKKMTRSTCLVFVLGAFVSRVQLSLAMGLGSLCNNGCDPVSTGGGDGSKCRDPDKAGGLYKQKNNCCTDSRADMECAPGYYAKNTGKGCGPWASFKAFACYPGSCRPDPCPGARVYTFVLLSFLTERGPHPPYVATPPAAPKVCHRLRSPKE